MKDRNKTADLKIMVAYSQAANYQERLLKVMKLLLNIEPIESLSKKSKEPTTDMGTAKDIGMGTAS